MDLSRPVRYRGYDLNDATFKNDDTYGIALDSVQWPGVQGVGYTEKRSQADGLDASDVYLGPRRLIVHGSVFGKTKADLFDRLQELRAICSPTGAYTAEPGAFGYLPLEFEEPTLRTTDFSSGYKALQVYVRPVQTPQIAILRDATGGKKERGGGIPFDAVFEAKDPRIYVRPETEYDMSNLPLKAGTLKNRGDYPSPLNMLFVVPAARPTGRLDLNAGGSQMRVTIPDSTAEQVFRYDGTSKILTVEENDIEALRMDLLAFLNNTTHPLVLPGSTAYSWTTTPSIAVGPDSRIWFWESFA